jgi:hypothetical protein
VSAAFYRFLTTDDIRYFYFRFLQRVILSFSKSAVSVFTLLRSGSAQRLPHKLSRKHT